VVGVHAFTVNTEDGAVHCRNFAPLYDIDEEAATERPTAPSLIICLKTAF
jgi:predicted PhzF superfamily epimerase YddE/YHI9